MKRGWAIVTTAVIGLAATRAGAQTLEVAHGAAFFLGEASPIAPSAYVPIDGGQRIDWIVGGTVGARSLCIGGLAVGLQTAWDVPPEWQRTWRGAARRYAQREADVAISSSIEAGLGAIWGEEPRYVRAPRGSIRSRARHAMKTVLLAQRRDGHLAPAWGRYAGNVFNNLLENQWLPPRATTTAQTALRTLNGFLGRLGGNLFEEFWPDVKARLQR
jgi:hypothetical protein